MGQGGLGGNISLSTHCRMLMFLLIFPEETRSVDLLGG
jgi:hypothetical protein